MDKTGTTKEYELEQYVISAENQQKLRARNAELEVEVARLRKALKGAKHFVPFLSGYYKEIEEALEASDG